MDQRVEDVVVASSEAESAPEHRFELVLRREFAIELAVTKLVVRGPLGQRLELTDSRQLEILVGLAQQVLPGLREAEQGIDAEWQTWRDALASPLRTSIREGE